MGLLDLLSGKDREPAECIIRVGSSGEEITDLYPFLVEVSVDTSRNEPAVATLKFETRRDEQGQWLVQDSGSLAPWEPIVIEAAFGSRTQEIMRGFIREIRADYPEEAGSALVFVECQDESFQLDRSHVRQVWGAEAPTSDTVIVSTILGRYGLSLDADSGAGQSNLVINQDDSDINFLRQRAEANGYDLLFSGGSVYFGPMRLDAAPQETIMVYAGPATNCLSFNVREDGHQADRVVFDRAETAGAGTVSETVEPDLPLLGTTSVLNQGSGLEEFSWRLTRQEGLSEDEWLARAQRRANELSLRIKAEGELDGSLYGHVLRVGEPVGVDGVGDRYSGIYFVDRVNHVFNIDGYRQSFHLLRNAYGDNLAGAGGLLAGVLGG
ncbi:MAG: phage late control D family protein [Thermodesulfobacteriota bacterium]